jgi:hypothetical protein
VRLAISLSLSVRSVVPFKINHKGRDDGHVLTVTNGTAGKTGVRNCERFRGQVLFSSSFINSVYS